MTDNDTPVPDPLAALVADDTAVPAPSAEVRATVEALIFASPEPITDLRVALPSEEQPGDDGAAEAEARAGVEEDAARAHADAMAAGQDEQPF